MEQGRSVKPLCDTCRNAFRCRRHHPAAPCPSQYTVCIHRHISATPAHLSNQVFLERRALPIRASRAGEETKEKCFINGFGVPNAGNQVAPGMALETEIQRGQHLPIPQHMHIWHSCWSAPVLLPSPLHLSCGQPGLRRAWRELDLWQRCATPGGMPPPPSSSRTAPMPVHGAHT